LERRAAAKKAPAKPKTPSKKPTPSSVETTHGAKTRAWMRHAERDIKEARDFRTLKGRVTQISNARAAGRISTREANHLRQMVYDRLDQLGLDRNGNRKQPTWRERVAAKVQSVRAKTPKTGAETNAYKALGNAVSIHEVEMVVDRAEAEHKLGNMGSTTPTTSRTSPRSRPT
jgi:hypothetical protein